MDYEEFYRQLQAQEKSVKDIMQRQQTTLKSISKNAEKGDLKSLSKDLSSMEALVSEHEGYLRELRKLTDGFDAREYMTSGDFAKQMLSYCESSGIDVKGDYPVYEMFPYKVKIDDENQDIQVDKKKVQSVRPQYLVSDIQKNREKLMKASFNASAFLNELAEAYDTLSEIKRKETNSKKSNPDLLLRDVYRCLVPMQRFRRDYDMQSFAFDLARLYSSDVEFTKDNRQCRFGSARGPNQMIRILDKNGKEVFISTIEFI